MCGLIILDDVLEDGLTTDIAVGERDRGVLVLRFDCTPAAPRPRARFRLERDGHNVVTRQTSLNPWATEVIR
ncbi:MAG: hypothetical protein RugAbin2_02353 [Rugosibacter sp.]|nr:hypothetical protein [Rugosibacter sp.]